MRRVLFIAKLAVTVLVAIYVLQNVESEEVGAAFAGASVGPILIGLGFLVISIAAGAARWCWIISHSDSEARLHFFASMRLLFEALFFNQLLPSIVGGDAVRVVRASTTSTLTLGTSFRTVIIDRATGLLALTSIAIVALVAFLVAGVPVRPELLYASGLMILLAAGGAVTLVGIGLFANERWRAYVPERLWRAYDQIVLISRDFVALNRRPRQFLILNGLGVVVHFFVIVAVFFLGLGLGIQSGLFDYFMVVPVSILVAVLPISIAGWGVREAMMVVAFSTVGVDAGDAVAVSLLFGASLALLGLVGGALFVVNSDHLRALREAIQGSSTSDEMLGCPDQPLGTSSGAE